MMGAWLANNWGWIGAILGAGGGGAVLTKIHSRWLDHSRDKRKQTDDIAMGLVEKLEVRIDKLEGALDQERANCNAELDVHRHRINNQRTIIYSLLHLFDVPATKRKVMLDAIRSDLHAMEQAEATEKGIVSTARMQALPAPTP